METLQRLPLTDCDVIQKLEQISDISALSKEDRMKYDESIKVYRDKLAIMAFERQKGQAEGREEGRAEGLKEGRAEGLKEGRAEGLEEGRAEGLKEGHTKGKLEVARNLKQMGMATEAIARATGLTAEAIEAL